MTDEERPADADAQIEREIRQGRKLGAQDLLAHIAGPGALKGASPVSPVHQAEAEIATWLGNNLADVDGALRVVLQRHLKGSTLLLDNLEKPLVAVAACLQRLLAAESLLGEVVSEADVEWGRTMGERPHFERDDVPAHPDDPYTVASVRRALHDALARLSEGDG